MSKFIQFHTLTSWSSVLLNRDQAGLAKRMPYGGAVRGRISSQCQKRAMQFAGGEHDLANIDGLDLGTRSRMLVDSIMGGLAEGRDPIAVDAVRDAFNTYIYGNADLDKRQALLMGEAETRYLTSLMRTALDKAPEVEITKKGKESDDDAKKRAIGDMCDADNYTGSGNNKKRKNFTKLIEGATVPESLRSALFGRMVTSDAMSQMEAAIYVKQAMTVSELESEVDFLVAVDELVERGTAGMFDAELISGLYYRYAVLDVGQALTNLGGDKAAAAEVARRLAYLFTTVTPGAKKGSTAPFARADFVMTEIGNTQPRSLDGAFWKPLAASSGLDGAVQSLTDYVTDQDDGYGVQEQRLVHLPRRLSHLASGDDVSLSAERVSVDHMAETIAKTIQEAA